MRKILLVVSILLCTYSVSNAQKMILSKAEISNVRYNIYYNKVYVKFDIIKAKKETYLMLALRHLMIQTVKLLCLQFLEIWIEFRQELAEQ